VRRFARILAIALVTAGGCAHTKTTDQGQETKGEEKTAPPPEAAKEKPRAKHAPARGDSGHEEGVPLATSAGGLLAPGAEQKIREQLVAHGFLADDAKRSATAMSEGLRRCQSAHDLPTTGMPDHATIKALGLNPDEIFRQGPVKD
jgi:hypothetical protein